VKNVDCFKLGLYEHPVFLKLGQVSVLKKQDKEKLKWKGWVLLEANSHV